MRGDERVSVALGREELPPRFDRWQLVLPAGTERPTTAAEWAGALVLIEAGTLEVDCLAGGRRAFRSGDLLVLGWLPIVTLHNRGPDEVRLLAVRRRGPPPTRRYLHHVRSPDPSGGSMPMGLRCRR